MKKIILLSAIFTLSSCSYFNGSKKNEEMQYYSFNEKNKQVVKKEDIYITRVTKTETLAAETAYLNSKYGNHSKPIGSWDFSQKPSAKLKDEITNKAIELGANHIVIFEKKDCVNIDIKKNEVEKLTGTNCYHILYYNLPIEIKEAKTTKTESTPNKPEEASKETGKSDNVIITK